jgi:hypothetical protein
LQQKKWHDFQGKESARKSRQPTVKGKNPYGTDSIQQHVSQNLGAFIEPYRPYGHRTAATEILGAIFEVTVQHLILDRPYCTAVLAQKSRVLLL